MIRVALILCLAASSAFGLWEKDLKITYDINPLTWGRTSYMAQPTTVSEAKAAGWKKMKNISVAKEYDASMFTLYCPAKQKTICLLFDDNGKLAGLQIAFNPAKYTGAVYDWNETGFLDWKAEDGITYKVTHQYYMSPDDQKIDPAERLEAWDDDYTVQGDVYVIGPDGELMAIPKDVKELKSSMYKQQACMPGMGNHYVYNMTNKFDCVNDILFKWFVLEYNNQIVGVQFIGLGKVEVDPEETEYFEYPGKMAIKMIVSKAPSCLGDFGDDPGVISMHTYFIKDAHLISCIW